MTNTTSAATATASRRRLLGWWVAVLFMVGSACFALGAFTPFAAAAGAQATGIVFFVGSIFFTSAALGQCLQSKRGQAAWWAAIIQLIGTLWFNLNTFDAIRTGSGVHQQDLRVWTPDFFGSVCFLVASVIALRLTSARPWRIRTNRGSTDWRIAAINLAGSVFFMAAAIAAFVRPATGNYLDASLANSGTFLGALCFFWGARLLLTDLEPAPPT